MADYSLQVINNRMLSDGEKFICECETGYKNRLKEISQRICEEKGRTLVLLAGPSSSGKTTTAELLIKQLKASHRIAKVISLDDFYSDQDKAYYFEDGTVDFETVKALDTEYISECMHSLMNNGKGEIPCFDFTTQKRVGYRHIEISEDEIIILEGIHALNPLISDPLSDERMLKLYISVSSRITDDSGVAMAKRDIRFVRRLIRDYRYRNSNVERTFYLWKGVRMGEDRYLFPYKDRADCKIDTIHPYEVNVFRKEAEKLLDEVTPDSIYYNAALHLKEKIGRFIYSDKNMIPENSLLREFGG